MVLNKPLNHLRPLLRLPTHQTAPSPDHFSANPSLLHHLPHSTGQSHTIVPSGSGSASAAGSGPSSAGTGRPGWSGTGPGSGGYTGHARAFLSLPQTGAVDPSQTFADDRREKQEQRRRLSVSFRQQMGREVKVVESPPDGVAGRRQLEGRMGRRMAIVDLGAQHDESELLGESSKTHRIHSSLPAHELVGSPSVDLVEMSNLTAEADSSDFNPANFLPQSPSFPPSPVPSHPSSRPSSPTQSTKSVRSKHQRGALSRSRSSLELWRVGIPQPPSPIPSFVRAFSTKSRTKPLPEVDEAVVTPTKRPALPSGPIDMDLAGVDIPTRRKVGLRRYSTSAVETSQPPAVTSSASKLEDAAEVAEATDEGVMSNNDLDKAIFAALIDARRRRDVADHQRLTAHYRSDRSEPPSDPALSKRLPLPTGWNHMTYTVILENAVLFRLPGESIAPILEIYNEMLERDLRPNTRGYTAVIQALCAREVEIWQLVERWEENQRWAVWPVVKYFEGISFTTGKSQHQLASTTPEAVEGYKSEGNFASALRLFRVACLTTRKDLSDVVRAQQATAVSLLLRAAAHKKDIDPKFAWELFSFASERDLPSHRSDYQSVFLACGQAKDRESVEELWNKFLQSKAAGRGRTLAEWRDRKDQIPGNAQGSAQRRLEGFDRAVWIAAIRAFILVGEVKRALEIFDQMQGSAKTRIAEEVTSDTEKVTSDTENVISGPEKVISDTSVPDGERLQGGQENQLDLIFSDLPKIPRAKDASTSIVGITLARNGYLDEALEFFSSLPPSFTHEATSWRALFSMMTPFIHAGRIRDVVKCLRPGFFSQDPSVVARDLTEHFYPLTFTRVYAAIVHDALTTSEEVDTDTLRWILAFHRILSGRPIPAPVVVAHIDLLIRIGKTQDLSHVITCCRVAATKFPEETADYSTIFDRISQPDVSLKDNLNCLPTMTRLAKLKNLARVEFVVKRYASERESVASAADLALEQKEWLKLAACFARFGASELGEGEMDEILVRFTEDLKSLVPDHQSAFFPELSVLTVVRRDPTVPGLSRVLVDRFGRERARSMLLPIFGEVVADRYTQPVIPQSNESATNAESASESEPNVTTPTSAVTPTPDNTQPISLHPSSAEPSQQATHKAPPKPLRNDTKMASSVDLHLYRGQVPAALKLIRQQFARGNACSPEAIGRVQIMVARQGDEATVRELHAISSQLLQSPFYADTPQRHAWVAVQNDMLISLCSLGKLEEAGSFRARLVAEGHSPSADAYGTMIASSKDTTDDALVARELFDEARAMGVQPNQFLYNTIISKLGKARKADMALELFKLMGAEGVSRSSVTYGGVINACCKIGDIQSAETLFQEMISQPDFRPRVPPFNTMMQYHLTSHIVSREKVLYYYNAMLRAGISPSEHTYKLLLDAYGTLAPIDLNAMERTFAELRASNKASVQGNHWASMISAYGIFANDVPKALEIFDSIFTSPAVSAEIKNVPVIWEAILTVLARNGTTEQLEAIRARMEAADSNRSAYIFNVLIDAYARSGQIEKAREIFATMGDSVTGVAAPNNHPTLLTSSGHAKPSTVTPAPTSIVYKEPSTYEAMIKAELSSGDRALAEQILARMEERRYPVAVYMRARSMLDELPGYAGKAGQGLGHLRLIFQPTPDLYTHPSKEAVVQGQLAA